MFATVREREQAVRSLRAQFAVRQETDAGSRTIDGVLVVRKPDQLRFRLMMPFGLTVFDYVSSGDDARVVHSMDSRPPEEQKGYGLFTREEFGLTFLRGPFAFPGNCVASEGLADVVFVDCRSTAGELLRKIAIDRKSGVILMEINFVGGLQRLKIQYEDYRLVDGVPLAFRIWLTDETRKFAARVTVKDYELNPSLDDSLFVP